MLVLYYILQRLASLFPLKSKNRPGERDLFVVTSTSAHIDHGFRCARGLLAGQSGATLAWEILLCLVLSIAAPPGLLLFAETPSEYVQGVGGTLFIKRVY